MNKMPGSSDGGDETPVANQSDDEILTDAKKYLEFYETAFGENDKAAIIDLEFLNGNHWPEKQKRQREIDGRPCITVNKLPTFINQVTNNQRQNRGSIKVSPVGDGADIETAEVINGMIKHIEYISNADVATDTAVASAAAIGRGYFRIMPDYVNEKSFDQYLCFKRIRNVFTVAFDPTSIEADGSDQQKCLVHVKYTKEAFKTEYPDARMSYENIGVGSAAYPANWLAHDWVRVAEFYRIEKTRAKLVRLSDGAIHWQDELPNADLLKQAGIYTVAERWSFKKKVMWYKITALEILERTEIKCDWIPVFPVYGSELDIDGKITYSGVIRHARDPQMMYDFWMTSATEEVALRPKTPFIGAKGQFDGFEGDWNQANNKTFSYLEYNPVTTDGQVVPPPQRQPMADIPAGMLMMAGHANDNIKGTTGLFDSSFGAAGNATSGKQELAQQHQGSVTNFHYEDNLTRTRRHAGRCIINMIPHYYDTERVVEIMREDGEIESRTINKQLSPEEQQQDYATRKAKAPEGDDRVAIRTVLNDLTVGRYAVVVSSGPSYDTMRQQAADAMVQFGQSWPKLMDIAGDKVVKAMDWPGATEIAERIERTIPPEIKYDPNDPNAGPPPIPPQVQQQIQQMEAMLKEMKAENDQLRAGVEKEQIKAESNQQVALIKADADQRVETIQAESRRDVEEIKGYIAMLIQQMQPPPEVKAAAADSMDQD